MLSFGDTVGKETPEGEPAQGGRGEEKALSTAVTSALPAGTELC